MYVYVQHGSSIETHFLYDARTQIAPVTVVVLPVTAGGTSNGQTKQSSLPTFCREKCCHLFSCGHQAYVNSISM